MISGAAPGFLPSASGCEPPPRAEREEDAGSGREEETASLEVRLAVARGEPSLCAPTGSGFRI